jgi:two-component system LytT family response regulator
MSNALRVYVVDDEPLAIDRLLRLLKDAQVSIAGSTTDPAEAVEFLSRNRVDALFLDIQMPEMNGFELLARLPDQPLVIFTTAYDQYALKAFEVNSIDFLLKPVDPEQLRRALHKLERLCGGAKPQWMQQPELSGLLRDLAASLRPPRSDYPARVASKVGEHVRLLELDGIAYFFARDKLTYAMCGGRAQVVDHTIAELEQKLDPKRFVRIHRSTLINLDWVQELHTRFGGQVAVRLKDEKQTQLAVSRDRLRALKDLLEL